jgi:hypothetical protein
MPTFKRADESVSDLACGVLEKFETHAPIIDAELKIDYVFAFPDYNEAGEPKNNALSKNGQKALGICRIVPLKDRALGRADAEISIDGHWWEDASKQERAALLDHELHHIHVLQDRDDLGRPKLKLRKHDFEFGWFAVVAARNGDYAMERQQAKRIMDLAGQYFWPYIAGEPTDANSKGNSVRKFVKSMPVAA